MPGTGVMAPDLVTLGENSRMLVGGVPGDANFVTNVTWIRFVSGTVASAPGPVDATDNMSGGFTEDSRGPRSLMVSADCLWRAADNPISAPVRFEGGQIGPRVIIWPDLLNDPNAYFKLPKSFCRGYVVTLAGTSEVRFSLDLKNQKTFFEPARPDPQGVAA
jgi:hypothetical protein